MAVALLEGARVIKVKVAVPATRLLRFTDAGASVVLTPGGSDATLSATVLVRFVVGVTLSFVVPV